MCCSVHTFLKEKKSYQGRNGDSASALAALLEESVILAPGDPAPSCGSREDQACSWCTDMQQAEQLYT